MRRTFFLCSIFCTVLFSSSTLLAQIYEDMEHEGIWTFEEIVSAGEQYFDTVGKGRGTGYKQFKRWEYFKRRALNDEGKIISNTEAYRNYMSFLQDQLEPSKRSTSPWSEMGPTSAVNTSSWSSHLGRVAAIDIQESNSNHLLIGAPTGGVWHSYDEGLNWTPIFDDQVMIDAYAVLINHSNAQSYIVGTNGLGILYSHDSGTTWQNATGTNSNVLINRLVMHPTDTNILLASGQSGKIYRSVNGGVHWSEVYSTSGNDYMLDLEFKPNDPTVVYASGEGFVLKSNDTGLTFSVLTGPWSNGSMMMAVTPNAPEYLYVLQEESEGFGALYRSTNSGLTFDIRSDDSGNNNNIMGYFLNEKGGQAPRDMDVVVSPTNKEEVHVAGIMTFKSNNGGQTWQQTTHWIHTNPLPFIHADCDIMIYKDDKIYFGTDGGIFISDDEAETFIDRTEGLGIRQFYRIGVAKSMSNRVSGGSQDNGTGVVSAGQWKDFVGADGMETFIDKTNANIIYASIQFGELYKSTNGGNTAIPIAEAPGSGDWVTPLEQDPIAANTLYQGKQQLYKSVNGGTSWYSISNFTPALPSDNKLTEIAIAPNNQSVIYTSFRRQIFKTSNGGSTWVEVTPPGTIFNVNYISIHPTDSDRVLLSLSSNVGTILETTNGGASWTDISTGLPNIGAECAIYRGGPTEGIFVGMNPGLFYQDTSTSSWVSIANGLPNVRVTELELGQSFLFVGTYGRGLWRAPINTIHGCTNPLAHNYNASALIDDGSCMTCTDGVMNGEETGVDCGGRICPTCTILGHDCPTVLDLSGVNITSGRYKADESIQSNNTLSGMINVDYESGQNIDLLPDFQVELGVEFEAKITPCIPE